jgi:hypothetical protein
MKPQDFTCILRLSKSQLQENGFKDAVVDKVYQQLLEYLASESHTISFPDTVVVTVIQVEDRHCYMYLLIICDLESIKSCKMTIPHSPV